MSIETKLRETSDTLLEALSQLHEQALEARNLKEFQRRMEELLK